MTPIHGERLREAHVASTRRSGVAVPMIVVHGVAMLGIDRQLREPSDVRGLTKYAIERLRTGIQAEGSAKA